MSMTSAIRLDVQKWPSADDTSLVSRLATHDAIVRVVSLHATEDELGRSVAALSAPELSRFEGYTNRVVARRFARTRTTLREILGAILRRAPADVPLHAGVHGKPVLARTAALRP